MHKIEPSNEHRWLQQLVGEWEWESPFSEDGGPPHLMRGTETVRAFGDLWIIAEGRSAKPGGGENGWIMTLGFDPQKGRFVGTFVSTMMTNLWVYDGALDGDVLTLDSEGPSFGPEGGLARYKDSIEFKAGGAERLLRSIVLGPDGNWTEFMRTTYRRT